MTMTFYNFKGNSKKLNKSKLLTKIATAEINAITPFSFSQPNFTVTYNSMLIKANYAFLHEYGFYYFLEEPELYEGCMQIRGRKDVLMSNLNDILNSQVIANRSSSRYDAYLPDDQTSIKGLCNMTYIRFPNELPLDEHGNNYCLRIGGR